MKMILIVRVRRMISPPRAFSAGYSFSVAVQVAEDLRGPA
jgi:hypothetical protein